MYTKHQNGTVSELLAQQFFVDKGTIVSKPIDGFNEYDLVLDNPIKSNIERAQVKTIYFDNAKRR